MFGWSKALVYRSRNRDDWEKAKNLLQDAGVEIFPAATEEIPVAGCGCKIHPGKMVNPERYTPVIYRIEVSTSDREKAEKILEGNVMPVLAV